MAGTLYLVATPIGNLEDITFRAVRVLREADAIACEDTRRTRGLLSHLGIAGKTLISCHEHNESARAVELARRVESGEAVALVSDAGMPGISDPGYRVVQAMIASGLRVTPVPGPCAVSAAVAASGLPTDAYRFCGFLPARKGQRRRALEGVRGETATLVFYEAPHRIGAALADVAEVLGPRNVVVAREISKLHEELLRGTAEGVGRAIEVRGGVKGEIVLVVAGASPTTACDDTPIEERIAELTSTGATRMDAIKQIARERGLAKREVYRRVHEPGGGNV
jgi:16S rRNA (cytidine1402-2'-O)-methyltransferase